MYLLGLFFLFDVLRRDHALQYIEIEKHMYFLQAPSFHSNYTMVLLEYFGSLSLLREYKFQSKNVMYVSLGITKEN